MKQILILLTALIFLTLGGACVTPALYKSTGSKGTIEEVVSSFLITQDGKQLIVVGKKHHYIFAVNDTLKFILTWPEKKRVNAKFYNFVINADQTVTGSYTLVVDAGQDLGPEALKLLLSKGFVPNNHQKTMLYFGSLQGKRYLADKFELHAMMQLNKEYMIPMRENYVSTSATIERILLTPLAVAADGVVVIGGIPLLLLTISVLSSE